MSVLKAEIESQLRNWTLVGPFTAPEGEGLWFKTSIDGLVKIPASFKLSGRQVGVTKTVVKNGVMDFEKIFNTEIDKTRFGKRKQVVAFTSLVVERECTLTLAYDAYWRVVWWLDGREVYATRDGNGGTPGCVKHRVVVALKPGKHVLSARVIPSNVKWALFFSVLSVAPGVADRLRTDRGARWRDYTNSVVRLEHRPVPDGTVGSLSKEDFELFMAKRGVDARWISVVDAHFGSWYKSKYMPVSGNARPAHEQQIAEWVKTLHANRVSVLSWYALSLNKAAWDKHPDWRQIYLVPNKAMENTRVTCCINSPYGDALIGYVVEALQKFDLDGFWFDGSAFSPIWGSPVPVSCVCRYCAGKFKADTGMDLPGRFDWALPEFRRWILWRYEMFGQYWDRLTSEVHKAVPEASIVFNHYHRENIGMPGAVPLNPFGKGFVSGIEADGQPMRALFYTRLMRAYERGHTEVWIHNAIAHKAVANGNELVQNTKEIMDFVVACATGGGSASVGGAEYADEGAVMGEIAAELKPRKPYINLPSIPQIGLHLSQQTETFVFGRDPAKLSDSWTDYYWNSLIGWHDLVAYSNLTCDVVFDEQITKKRLAKYRVFVAPLAVALSSRQRAVLMEYVKNGGTLVTGPWFGLKDEFGEEVSVRRLPDESLFPFGRAFPDWNKFEKWPELNFFFPCGSRLAGRPIAAQEVGPKEISLDFAVKNPVLKRSKFGKGELIQFGIDMGTVFRYSKAEAVVDAGQTFFKSLKFSPLVDLKNGKGIVLGLFGSEKDAVIHIQQAPVPWNPDDITVEKRLPRRDVELIWNGKKPVSARCALGDIDVEISVRKRGKSWCLTIPPFARGQVVLIRT